MSKKFNLCTYTLVFKIAVFIFIINWQTKSVVLNNLRMKGVPALRYAQSSSS